MNTYKTIAAQHTFIHKEKASKFIAYAFPITTEEEFKVELQKIKKQYYDATHHCYAFVTNPENPIYKHSDDREPSGTAGIVIEGQLKSLQLLNVAVIVIRYFGGTKLGTGGLKQSYKLATQQCLLHTNVINKNLTYTYIINCHYESLHQIIFLLKKFETEIISKTISEECTIKFCIFKAHKEHFLKEVKLFQKINISEYQHV